MNDILVHIYSTQLLAAQIVLQPLIIHLTYSLGLALQDYFQLGGRDDGGEGGEPAASEGTRGVAEDQEVGGWILRKQGGRLGSGSGA
jgi:hypothetical protein